MQPIIRLQFCFGSWLDSRQKHIYFVRRLPEMKLKIAANTSANIFAEGFLNSYFQSFSMLHNHFFSLFFQYRWVFLYNLSNSGVNCAPSMLKINHIEAAVMTIKV